MSNLSPRSRRSRSSTSGIRSSATQSFGAWKKRSGGWHSSLRSEKRHNLLDNGGIAPHPMKPPPRGRHPLRPRPRSPGGGARLPTPPPTVPVGGSEHGDPPPPGGGGEGGG